MSDVRPPLGRIITFYSYKGGTGRSMALANIAWVLASAGRSVLVIDWDLEAPGLHRYFRPFLIDEELTATDGLMDFVDRYATAAIKPADSTTTDPGWYLPFTDFDDYKVSVNFKHFRSGGKIDLLPAGRQGDHYALAVSTFNWQNFYDRLGGGGFMEAFKQRARSKYDYVLLDSRTGVSDTAGICSVQMPDTLVVCYTYNNQSIRGASAVAHSAVLQHDKLIEEKLALHRSGKAAPSESPLDATGRPYRIFPVAMRVDNGESDRLALRQAFARDAFSDLIAHIGADNLGEYWKSVEVPHTVYYSYEEVLATFKDDPDDPKAVLTALLRLTRYITDRDVTDYRLPITPQQRQDFLDAFAETPLTGAAKRALSESQRETDEQAVARTAEAAFGEMSEADRKTAALVMMRLIRVGRDEDGGGYFANRVPLREFKPEEQQIIGRLVSSRVLVVTQEVAVGGKTDLGTEGFVTFADPRILTSWRTLTDWIAENRDFLIWRQQLRTYLNDWQRSGHDRGALLSGRILNEADLQALRRENQLTTAELDYIQQSRVAAKSKAADRSSFVIGAAIVVALVLWQTGLVQRYFVGPDKPGNTTPSILVPQLVGMTSNAARTAAEKVGLQVVMTDGTAEVPFIDGVVVKQTPPDQAAAALGDTVHLTVSADLVVTPTIVGRSLSDALSTLTAQRLQLGKTESRYIADAKFDSIVQQQPEPGNKVPAATQVNVVVSRAPQLGDIRIAIQFDGANQDSKWLADRVKGLIAKGGGNALLAPRTEGYFDRRGSSPSAVTAGSTRNEIRYGPSLPGVQGLARDVERLLKSGGLSNFDVTRSASAEETLSVIIFPTQGTYTVSVNVEGVPGEPVQIWSRGNRESGEAPILFTGKIGDNGRVSVTVPRDYLMLGRPVRSDGTPLDLLKEQAAAVTVKLLPSRSQSKK